MKLFGDDPMEDLVTVDIEPLRVTVRRLVKAWDAASDRDERLVIGACMVTAAEALERAL